MNDMNRTILAGVVAALIAVPALAQETAPAPAPTPAPAGETTEAVPANEATEAAPAEADAPAEGEAATPEEALGLSMGESEVGQTYVDEVSGDWEVRCVRTESGEDPCQLYQLLQDEAGNSVAEISVFPLPAGEQAVAGATVITPLETLLTAQIGLRVDQGGVKRYPFSWCSEIGCFSRIGFTQADLDSFKRGAEATLTIRPVAAPDQTVDLAVSLSGFTAGYEAIVASNAALEE